MQRYFVEITIHGTDLLDRDQVRRALEAAEDVCQVDDVILVPFHVEKDKAHLVSSGEMKGHYYALSIDGPTFRAQRELLLQLLESSQQQATLTLSPEQGELLEGLVNLTDAIADQAADCYAIECLLQDQGR